jgi:hypothetical protein
MHRAKMTTSLFLFQLPFFSLNKLSIAASTRGLWRSLTGFLQMPPRLRDSATMALRMPLFFIRCKGNARAKQTNRKPMSFQ